MLTTRTTQTELPMEEIADFCRRWKIARLEVFGSFLSVDFRPDSDLDFLATFDPDADWSLLDRVSMKLELEAVLHREVDLLKRATLERHKQNERSQDILRSAKLFYARS